MLAILLAVPGLLAQTVTGNITGEVTDPSGAVVPGAQVVAHNLDTGVASPATTNSVGLYRIDFLPIGRYQVGVRRLDLSARRCPRFHWKRSRLQTST